MQSIEQAASLTAAYGMMAALPTQAPRVVERPAPVESTMTKRSADAAAFGRDSFAVFSVDEDSGRTKIAIYDGDGRLMRMIPPNGVSDMLAQLAAYRRLR